MVISMVNGRRVTVFRLLWLQEGDVIEVREQSKKMLVIKESLKEFTRSGVLPWMEVDPDQMQGVVKNLPIRNDIVDVEDIKEQLIVELYSR